MGRHVISYEGREHWHATAELSDGTTIEFERLYSANGNYHLEEVEQYRIETELLNRAAETGKVVIFYSVNYIDV